MDEKASFPCVNALVRYRRTRREPHLPVQEVHRGGLGLFSADALEVGECLELDLFFPDSTGVSVAAQVAWVETVDAGRRYHAGVEFLAASDEALEKIDEFVDRKTGSS